MIKYLKNHDKYDWIIIFLICFLPSFFISINSMPLIFLADETSAISIAAKIAGYNWNDVVSSAGYYGFGFLFIFAPLFKIIDSPILIYKCILSVQAFVGAGTSIIAFSIIKKYFCQIKRLDRDLLAILAGQLVLVNVVAVNIKNEEILDLTVWIVAFLLCKKIWDQNTKKTDFFLLIILGYSLTLHTRAIVSIIGIFLIGIIYKIITKKSLFRFRFYLLCIIECIAIKYVISLYQKSIWTGEVMNSSVSSAAIYSLKNISINLTLIKAFFNIVFGEIYTATIFTGGIFIFSMSFFLLYFKGRKFKCNSKEEECLLCAGGFSLICTLLLLMGMGTIWLFNAYQPMIEKGLYQYDNGYRAFTYLRYMGAYIGPYIMCGIIIALMNKKLEVKAMKLYILLIFFLTIYWIFNIYTYLSNYKTPNIFFMAINHTKVGISMSRNDWLMILVFLLSITLLIFFAFKNKALIIVIVSIVLLFSERIYVFRNSTSIIQKRQFEYADSGFDLLNRLDDDNVNLNDIYVLDDDEIKNQLYYEYQFLNFRKHVMITLPNELKKDMLIFCNSNISDLVNSDFKWAQLDENEFVFCSGEKIQQALYRNGINLNQVSN